MSMTAALVEELLKVFARVCVCVCVCGGGGGGGSRNRIKGLVLDFYLCDDKV